MSQNRNKLIELLISNLSNAIIHSILERSTGKSELSEKYRKELINSFNIAKIYREKINPIAKSLPLIDISHIKEKLTRKVNSELILRISKGYNDIDLNSVEKEVEESLKNLLVI
ncbi:MAG: hypothetical protein Q7R87_01800 [Nanoarchaeota archaeon]|nr:hypothetical protein [Nanoarchaeota archaeon]